MSLGPLETVAQRRAIVDAYIRLALGTVRERIESGWIDQAHSPLGPRWHVDAVKRRLAEGRADARVRGRRAMLTIDAIAEEYFGSPEVRLALVRLDRQAPAENDNGDEVFE